MSLTDLLHPRSSRTEEPPREYWQDRRVVVATRTDLCAHGVALDDPCEHCQLEVWHTFGIPIDEQDATDA